MSRKVKRGLGPGTRGRHKKRKSRETRWWNRAEPRILGVFKKAEKDIGG